MECKFGEIRMKRKILIIGVGGIGSFLVPILDKVGLYAITVADPDKVLYNSDIKWLDLRAQGRNAAFVTYDADPKMYDTLLAGPEGSFSCQGDSWDGSNSGVHFMQTAIAGIGAQWIQRWFNDEQVKSFMMLNV